MTLHRILFLAASLALSACDARQIDICAPGDNVICRIARPEDLEAVPGTDWLLVSELGVAPGPGRILLVDPATQERRVLAEGPPPLAGPSAVPRCGPPPAELRPRGFHLTMGDDGKMYVLVVAGQRIERYILNLAADVPLAWEGCVTIPPEIFANDVAGFPDGGFVVSHMYDLPRTWVHDIKLVLGMSTGYAVTWSAGPSSADGGWKRVPNTDAAFANGIQVDPATSRIYVSSMYGQRILGVDRDGGHPIRSDRTPIQGDNLSWADDGRLINAGHTGIPIYGTRKCTQINGAPCAFPFAVVAFDPKTLAQETLFETNGGTIPAASVALIEDRAIYLGSAFGDRITRVSLMKGQSLP
jgi:hypothetical protein